MRVAHILRKYNPAEWGGTETAVKRLLDGLKAHNVQPVVFCPKLDVAPTFSPLAESGCEIRRFKAFAPVWGVSAEQKQQLVAVGGNLMSFDLIWKLWREKDISLIHTHAGNRLGGIALTIAQQRRLPLVATIHGGVLDLPPAAREFLRKPLEGGVEWGRVFGALLQARKVLAEADAILTCNKKEAELQRKQFPNKRVIIQPHGVTMGDYQKDCRLAARNAFPKIIGKQVLLVVGRIDPVKNQAWVVEEGPALLQKFPDAVIVMAGSCTDVAYGKMVEKRIQSLGLENRILLTGGLPPNDPRLLGLFQEARVVVLPSVSETFGLVILEAWSAGTAVISSRTSGASDLITHAENGWLFDLELPATFHQAVEAALENPELTQRFAETGRALVKDKYDVTVLGGRMKKLYEELIEEKKK